jgi:hypothetical protein
MYNRISSIKRNLSSFSSSDELRREILNVLDETTDRPEVGKYYTFLHMPNKRIHHDRHPLVATTKMKDWGFSGVNFNSKKYGNYDWNSVKSKYHSIRQNELSDLVEMRFGKYYLNR